MTKSDFCMLMVLRRKFGDLGNEVLLPQESCKALMSEYPYRQTLADDAQNLGYFTVLSCNGPTKVRST